MRSPSYITLEGHPFPDRITISAYEDGRSAVRRVNDLEAIGRAFKESCCPFPHNGAGCPLGDKCPCGYVFETSPAFLRDEP
jgi:hypothetical protein